MGACSTRGVERLDNIDNQGPLIVSGRHRGLSLCAAPASPDEDSAEHPFVYHINFRPAADVDLEGRCVNHLLAFLWLAEHCHPRIWEEAVRLVGESLFALRTVKGAALLHFIPPLANVLLQARCKAAAATLWSTVMSEVVRYDEFLAHSLFWALKAVTTSPQASRSEQREGQEKMREVALALSPDGATPLIDLMQKLHLIGEDLVRVKDRDERAVFLRQRLEEEINNDSALGRMSMPVRKLAPVTSRWHGPIGDHAVLLGTLPKESRVLASKERAPFLVVLELHAVSLNDSNGAQPSRFGLCPCRHRFHEPVTVQNGHNGNSSSGRPKRGLSMQTLSLEEEVGQYLRENVSRPQGLFKHENWDQVVQRVGCESYHGAKHGWNILPLIVKSNADDVRQEELAFHLLKWFERLFTRCKLPLWLHPFMILATSHDGGCLEVVSNAISISELKKSYGRSLRQHFEVSFPLEGGNGSPSMQRAILNFIQSMAAYSIVCYVLAIRDRHNGNILLDNEGHILHVDFGFMLCGAPGGKALQKLGGFEPSLGFKLTRELMEVMGPPDHKPFEVFRSLFLDGIVAVRQNVEELLALLQLSMVGAANSSMNCFQHPRGYPEAVLEDICDRLCLPNGSTSSPKSSDAEFRTLMEERIDDTIDHWRSQAYDTYQYYFTGVH